MPGAEAADRAAPRLIAIEDFLQAGWGSEQQDRGRWCCERLEEGYVLLFHDTPFPFPQVHHHFLLGVEQTGAGYHKNIAYRPRQGRLTGYAKSADAVRLREVLSDYSRQAAEFVRRLLPPYASHLRLDYASFRPVEEQGRPLPPRARNDLLHVDSFPTRAANGSSILRVFTNIHPERARVWATAEPFDMLASEYAAEAGLDRFAARSRSVLASAAFRALRLAARLRLPVHPRSPYDAFMLHFHDWLKASERFQRSPQRRQIEFPPGATWLCFTDRVPHAVLAGQFALEQTFFVPTSAWVLPQKAPVAVLERLSGARLCAHE